MKKLYHEHQISLSTLKRRFKALNLNKRALIPWTADEEDVNNDAQKELDGSGASLGYRKFGLAGKSKRFL